MAPNVPSPPSSASGDDGRMLREAASGELARRFPWRWLDEQAVLPLRLETDAGGASAWVAADGELPALVHAALVKRLGARLQVIPTRASDIRAALLAARAPDAGAGMRAPTVTDDRVASVDDLRAQASREPVVQLVHAMLAEAVRAGASDLHVESTASGLRIRQRLDGVLRDVQTLGTEFRAAVISRIKVMASLDIAERRVPQDGRTRLQVAGREVDVRVATLPALHGESVVLRLLDGNQAGATETLESLGFSNALRTRWRQLVHRPDGLLLATGPTGSGKSTTLHAALRERSTADVKVITVEDPVEYRVDGAVQLPVNTRSGFGFASALRAMLRHDPDVILVGEMRDVETAELAVRAALTGHLVLSTLHTTDAAGAVQRLRDMGIASYLLAGTLRGVLAQRLLRRVCAACGEERAPTHVERSAYAAAQQRSPGIGPPALDAIAVGRGCSACSGTGFRGRVAIGELLEPEAGEAAPLPDLIGDGWRAVAAGFTTPGELFRVLTVESVG
jgi:type II secretory ATPase GspE/PulE/Tfp pilus assembly ATPase PilB-like protein